jgi:hypothetical protein
MGELRQYPRGAWLGFRPLGSPLEQEFDDPDEVDAIIERVRRCGTVVAGELVLPNSGDSWNGFCSFHGTYEFFTEWQPEYQRANFVPPRPVTMRAQREQERWEAEQLARRQAQQAASDALWAAEEQRRERAAATARAARGYLLALQERQATTLMDRWNALVARKGWTPAEAAERWNDWLTGPPGFFG